MSDLMDSFRLDGKVALVTGATYGIGMLSPRRSESWRQDRL